MVKKKTPNFQVEIGTVTLKIPGLDLESLALPYSISICFSILLKCTHLTSKENISWKEGYKTLNSILYFQIQKFHVTKFLIRDKDIV